MEHFTYLFYTCVSLLLIMTNGACTIDSTILCCFVPLLIPHYHTLAFSANFISHLCLIPTCAYIIVWFLFCFEVAIKIDFLVVLACIYFSRSFWLQLILYMSLDLKIDYVPSENFLYVIMCCICMLYLANLTTYFLSLGVVTTVLYGFLSGIPYSSLSFIHSILPLT